MEQRIKYLINSFVIMLAGGTVYSYSIFRKPVEEYLNISSVQSGLPFKVFLMLFAFSMPLSGYLIEKLGVRKTYIIGSFMIVASLISSYFINSIWCFIFTYGVLGGVGTGIIYGVPLKVVSLWFSDKKGIATGITVAGFGLSSFAAAQIFKFFITRYGILLSFFYFGLVIFAVLFLCYFNVIIPDKDLDRESYHTGYDTLFVLKDKRFYTLYICFVFACSVSLTSVSFTASYFIDFFNLDIKKASYIVSVMAVLNATGRPFYGYISDRFGFISACIISFSMYFIAGLLFIFAGNYFYSVLLGFMIIWFNLGGWLAIAPVSTMRFFGLSHYAKNYGAVYTAYGIGALIGMNMINFLNYNLFFIYSVIFASIMTFAIFANRKKIKYEF